MLNKSIEAILHPVAKYDGDTIIRCAEDAQKRAQDAVEYDCWQTIIRIGRFVRFVEYIFGDDEERVE